MDVAGEAHERRIRETEQWCSDLLIKPLELFDFDATPALDRRLIHIGRKGG